MSKRERLPDRRHNRTFKFEHSGHRYFGTVGFYPLHTMPWMPDLNRPAEVFLDAGKPGTDLQHMARAGAVFLSLALQYGCPINVIRDALPVLEDGSSTDPFGTLLRLVREDLGQ